MQTRNSALQLRAQCDQQQPLRRTEESIVESGDALRADFRHRRRLPAPADSRADVPQRFFGDSDPNAYLALQHRIRTPRVATGSAPDLPRQLKICHSVGAPNLSGRRMPAMGSAEAAVGGDRRREQAQREASRLTTTANGVSLCPMPCDQGMRR
jgi:hypothetical protein